MFVCKTDYQVKSLNLLGGKKDMSRVCAICGKKQVAGNNVSHSKRRTRRTFKANVQKVSFVQNGKVVKDYVCAKCLKSNKVERA